MCSPESDGRWRRWSPCRQQLLVCSGCGKSCCNITQLRGAQLASNTLSHKYDTAIMRVEVEVVLCLPSLHSSAVLRAWERWTRTPGHRPLYKHADINSAACCGHSFWVVIKQIDRDKPKLWQMHLQSVRGQLRASYEQVHMHGLSCISEPDNKR